MKELSYKEVENIWVSVRGKDTVGILHWFKDFIVKWESEIISAQEVKELKLLGGDHGSRGDLLTQGTYKIVDASNFSVNEGFQWDDTWYLITVRNPENNMCVLIDGNDRALQLYAAIRRNRILANKPIKIIIGDLDLLIIRIGKGISSLWK